MLKSQIESLLFISAKPMSARQLAGLLKLEEAAVRSACEELVGDYAGSGRGIQIIKNGSKYQMASAPENARVVQEFIQDETTGELSRPSLETLTIIAYRGPVSKTDLDRIRGVNCSLIIRNLLLRGLIEARADKAKEETYYTVTFDFIRFLGIGDLKELPDYERLSRDDSIDRFLAGADAVPAAADSGPALADLDSDSPTDESDPAANDQIDENETGEENIPIDPVLALDDREDEDEEEDEEGEDEDEEEVEEGEDEDEEDDGEEEEEEEEITVIKIS